MFGGKIEDRSVNSLFDGKENYNRSIILLQERGDIQTQISPLFNIGFFDVAMESESYFSLTG